MNNKGQTTVFFSLIISVLLIFTLSALEVGRIYMGRVKARSVIHSTCSSVLADYNSELFERYHLLFMDPTYGTESEAVLEEKATDYIECSLNGEKEQGNGIYTFKVSDVMLVDREGILDNDMELFKTQIEDYEKSAGTIESVKTLITGMKDDEGRIKKAARETEDNGVELPAKEKSSEESKDSGAENDDNPAEKIEVTDPRDTLETMLKPGILAITLPAGTSVSDKKYEFGDNAPSVKYKEADEKEKDTSFRDISFLVGFLKSSAATDITKNLGRKAAFIDYARRHFSDGINPKEDSVHKCEIEYILKGKDSDYENMKAVVNDILWQRMPVNYAYLLTDDEKKSEALVVATGICAVTFTEELIEVVKYLLLGCWAYGESICEVRTLLHGEKIPYVKTKENWLTDLDSLGGTAAAKGSEQGISYEGYLMLLLAGKGGKSLDKCYARMLDLIDANIRRDNPDFMLKNCVGKMGIQGEVSVDSRFVKGKDESLYSIYFDELLEY